MCTIFEKTREVPRTFIEKFRNITLHNSRIMQKVPQYSGTITEHSKEFQKNLKYSRIVE